MTSDERDRRANNGAAAVRAGTPDYGENGADEDGRRTDVADTLANVRLYCDRQGIDYERADESARINYLDEREVEGEYTVFALYVDNGQRFTTTVPASGPEEAERLARAEAEAEIQIAGVAPGAVATVDEDPVAVGRCASS